MFDYRSSSVVKDLVAAIGKEKLEFAGVYDAVSTPDSVALGAKVALGVKGGKKFIATTLAPPKDLSEGVEATSGASSSPSSTSSHSVLTLRRRAPPVFAPNIVSQHSSRIALSIYHDFVPAALASGSLKAKPEPLIVGKGLESVQKGLDRQREGVSARKVVVTIV